jgi:hypothetical protein
MLSWVGATCNYVAANPDPARISMIEKSNKFPDWPESARFWLRIGIHISGEFPVRSGTSDHCPSQCVRGPEGVNSVAVYDYQPTRKAATRMLVPLHLLNNTSRALAHEGRGQQ